MTEVQRLSSFLQVEPATIEAQQWSALLPALLARAADYESIQSRNLVLEVELEQTNRQSERRVAAATQQAIAAQSELQQLKESESVRNSRQEESVQQVQRQNDEQNISQDKIIALSRQNAELVEQKRQALALVDRQGQVVSRHEEEYKSLSGRYKALREDSAMLESQVSEARSISSAAKCTSLEQSLALAEKNVEYLSTELQAKTEQFATYRRENNALLVTVQKEADVAKSEAAASIHSLDLANSRNQELTTSLDQNLVRLAELQEQLSTKEESFRNEMAAQTRLIELHERSSRDAKSRISQLERSLEQRSSHEFEDIEAYVQSANSAQAQCAELERVLAQHRDDIDRLEKELEIANERLATGSGSMTNGIGLLSPSAQIISKVQNSGMSLTQLYAEYLHTKQDLEHERRKNAKIQTSFDALISELEARAPQLQQQREEYSELQSELAAMSEQLQGATDKVETLTRDATIAETLARDQNREIQAHEAQVHDLSRQVQKLLFEVEEQGFRNKPLSEAEVTALNRMLTDKSSSNSAVDNLISDRLVLFKNIQDLQQQNQQQLKITRQLGAKMEADEEASRTKVSEMESEALADANQTISQLTAKIQSMQVKMDSYLRERDMFRGMLSNASARTGTVSIATATKDDGSANELTQNALNELQQEFEIYKKESAADYKELSVQLSSIVKEKSDLVLQVARLSSQLELAEERRKMFSGAMDMMRKEVEESRKRTSQIQENIAKQDYRGQQDAEELVEIRAMLSSVRNENANYKAEKQLWKSIEQRISDENSVIRTERDRLNKLLANLQALQSERERTETEMTQRYGHQIAALEGDLEVTKSRLDSERDEVRRMTLIRDQHNREAQEKAEGLLRQIADAREALAISTTEKNSTQSRITDLEAQLSAAHQKLSVLTQTRTSGNASSSIGTDQQLQLDLADVRLSLENTKNDLNAARSKATEMQALADAAEKALEQMNESFDAFKSSQGEAANDYASEKSALQQRVEDLTEQLNSVNRELASIHKVESDKHLAIQREVETLNNQLNALRDVEEKYTIASSFYQEDLRSQAEIAQEAQQNYENELMKHAEAAQTLRSLRHDYNELRTEVLTLRTASSNAEKHLADEKTSWHSQQELYERELSDLKARLTDLRRQNELLHDQFESFTNQYASRPATSGELNVNDTESEGVQEVIKYLRREKEIVEVSLEVVQQENKRMKQQLNRTTKALDDTQTNLILERQKAAQSSLQAAQGEGLQHKLAELSMVRESNSTLRAENEANVTKVRTLEDQLRTVSLKIEPLETEMRVTRAEFEAKTEEVRLLTEDNERWRQRNQAILQKYERIDPAELQQLREKAAGASEQLEELRSSVSSLQAQVQEREINANSLQEQLNGQISKYDALMQQSRDRIKKERTDAKKALASVQASTEQLDAQALELESLKRKVEEADATAKEMPALEALQSQIKDLQAQISEKESTLETKKTESERQMAELQSTIDRLTQEKNEVQTNPKDEDGPSSTDALQAELDKTKAELEKQKSNYKELRQAAKKNKDELVTTTTQLTSARSELDVLQSQLDLENKTGNENSDEAIQKRIDEAVAQALKDTSDNSGENEAAAVEDLQEKIKEALAQQALVNEAETQRLVAEALAKSASEHAEKGESGGQNPDLEALLLAKEEEYKAKLRLITKERVDTLVESRLPKKIEAEKQNWLKEAEAEKNKLIAEKDAEMQEALRVMETKNNELLETRAANVRKESDMRNQLKIGMKDKKIAKLEQSIAEMSASNKDPVATAPTVEKTQEMDNGKSQDLFHDMSEHSEGEPEEGQASGTETPTAAQTKGDKADGPTTRSRGGRGGKQQRGGRRGGHQGTKRPREEGSNAEGEQPTKKAA